MEFQQRVPSLSFADLGGVHFCSPLQATGLGFYRAIFICLIIFSIQKSPRLTVRGFFYGSSGIL
jgi:hypothetical protein